MPRPEDKPLYDSAAWQRRRAEQLEREPMCAFHLKRGLYRAATVADHITPHRGDEEAFFTGALQSLCRKCHSSDKQAIEAGGTPKVRPDASWGL